MRLILALLLAGCGAPGEATNQQPPHVVAQEEPVHEAAEDPLMDIPEALHLVIVLDPLAGKHLDMRLQSADGSVWLGGVLADNTRSHPVGFRIVLSAAEQAAYAAHLAAVRAMPSRCEPGPIPPDSPLFTIDEPLSSSGPQTAQWFYSDVDAHDPCLAFVRFSEFVYRLWEREHPE